MRPLSIDQVRTIGSKLKDAENWRDYALFRFGIDSMLRASDLVRVLDEDVLNPDGTIVEDVENLR